MAFAENLGNNYPEGTTITTVTTYTKDGPVSEVVGMSIPLESPATAEELAIEAEFGQALQDAATQDPKFGQWLKRNDLYVNPPTND